MSARFQRESKAPEPGPPRPPRGNRRSAIDDRTTTHVSYEISQIKRKRVEQVFGWGKTVGPIRKAKHRGVERVGWMFTFTQSAYNLVRMRPLLCPT